MVAKPTIEMNKPPGEAHLPFGMSALLFLGGVIGYSRKRSVPSLVAGVSLGAGYAVGGWLISKGDGKEGHGLSLTLSTLLSGAMGARFYRTRKIIPPGLLLVAGGFSAVYHGRALRDWL